MFIMPFVPLSLCVTLPLIVQLLSLSVLITVTVTRASPTMPAFIAFDRCQWQVVRENLGFESNPILASCLGGRSLPRHRGLIP